VENHDAYFFTNNSRLESAIEAAGWKYVFVDFPLSDDGAISSFQSKYIKFLQFLKNKDYSFIDKYDTIIYTDHKLELKDSHVKYLLERMNGHEILVRDHPGNRKNIWEEVGAAMFQERYLRFMPQTIDYVRKKAHSGYSEKPVVVATGLIVYRHLNKNTMDFVDEVYSDLESIGTSECQIVWSMLGQKHTDIIKIIGWDELDIKWKEPKHKAKKFMNYVKNMIKWIFPHGIICLIEKLRKQMRKKRKRRRSKDQMAECAVSGTDR
jgi:hypothetical protein